jgi:ankyrin repeat protein
MNFQRTEPPGSNQLPKSGLRGIPPDDLTRAALKGDVGLLASMLERGGDPDCIDKEGRTPLMEAAFGGHAEAVRLLLDWRANPNAPGADGWTPLMEAASKGRRHIIQLLLDAGADVNVKGSGGWTALAVSAHDRSKIARILRTAGAR